MPLHPLFGLSTLFHLGTILWNKALAPFPLRRTHGVRRGVPGNILPRVLGCAIIASMFAFVLAGAGLLVYSSVRDAHATFRYIPPLANGLVARITTMAPVLIPLLQELLPLFSISFLIALFYLGRYIFPAVLVDTQGRLETK